MIKAVWKMIIRFMRFLFITFKSQQTKMRCSSRKIIYAAGIFFIILVLLVFTKSWPFQKKSYSYGATNELIKPFAYPVLINPMIPACSNPNSTKNIVIIVHTHPKNDNRRSRIRSTIGNETLKNFIGFDIVFVMGKPVNESLQMDVDQEAAQYGDILQADFADKYWNLTTKAIVWIKYLAENCADKNPFILKMDDDVVFDVAKMKDIFLMNAKELQNNFYCNVRTHTPIFRQKGYKWRVPETEMSLSYKYYDDYCLGYAYLTSTNVIVKEWKYMKSHKVHFHKIDDFFVTGKLAGEVNVGLINGYGEFRQVLNWERIVNTANIVFYVCHDPEHLPIIWKHIYDRSLKGILNNPLIA